MPQIKHKLITLFNWDIHNSFMVLSFWNIIRNLYFWIELKSFLIARVEVEWADNKVSIKTSLEKAL